MNTHFETNFTIMPTQTNYMTPMVFGGSLYSEIDLCAASCVKRFLYDSRCSAAVTHKSNVTYLAPTYLGDIIYLLAYVKDVGKKSIVVEVTAHRERYGSSRKIIANGEFVFISIEHSNNVSNKPDKLPYAEHGLKEIFKSHIKYLKDSNNKNT